MGIFNFGKKNLPEVSINRAAKAEQPEPVVEQKPTPEVQPYQIQVVTVKPAETNVVSINSDAPRPIGFFASIYDQLRREEELLSSIDLAQKQDFLSRDLMHEMRGYWQGRESLLSSRELDSGIKQQFEELIRLENEWQQLQDQQERTRMIITEKEMDIETKLTDLRQSLRDIKLKQSVGMNEAFKLEDGRSARSLEELGLLLQGMDQNTFYSHVSDSKNDFAQWARAVLHEEELAGKIESERSPQGAAQAISSFYG